MKFHSLDATLSVSSQIHPEHVEAVRAAGFRSIICNRPDGEDCEQPNFREIQDAASALGIVVRHLPVGSGNVLVGDAEAFEQLLIELPGPVLAYCRTGLRSTSMWALCNAATESLPLLLKKAMNAGFDLRGLQRRIANGGTKPLEAIDASHQIVIVGGGAAGVAAASSLLARNAGLDIAIIDPSDVHCYQPGWTMVGAGVFPSGHTARTLVSVIPKGVHWIKAAVAAFEPERNVVILEGCRVVRYQQLIVCPGLKLDWGAVDGLEDTLGRNGVTSNYRFDLAPYTWDLVQRLKGGRALFTQPAMPIKCAGAPQKAMYLSSDHWMRSGLLNETDVQFYSAGSVLFGVADYVPALMEYVKRYDITLNFAHTLTSVDGAAKTATFACTMPDGSVESITSEFDIIHVVPPQVPPDFIRVSPLADGIGWMDVDPATMRHKVYRNVFGMGDVVNTSNAKTAAAVRKQAPVVAHNLLVSLGQETAEVSYNGYGSCPLTVERGKIVLAEFLYGGKVAPSFPKWLIDGTRPSRTAWLLKERILPALYWDAMLKGREWLARPERIR